MTTEEHIQRIEKNLHGLAVVQDQMMDLLGMTAEGERRLATQMAESRAQHEEFRLHHERTMKEIDLKLAETGEKLNALIGVVDGFVRGKG